MNTKPNCLFHLPSEDTLDPEFRGFLAGVFRRLQEEAWVYVIEPDRDVAEDDEFGVRYLPKSDDITNRFGDLAAVAWLDGQRSDRYRSGRFEATMDPRKATIADAQKLFLQILESVLEKSPAPKRSRAA